MSATALVRSLFAAIVVGLMAIVFSISFAAIIYSGEMAPYLSRGIGLTLLGAAIMAAVGAVCLSYNGTIVQPQDVTAILLSLVVASIAGSWIGAPSDALFATVAMFVAVATAVAGFVTFIFGYLRLGFIVRFVPYPVLGGFLAATGYLLIVGAIGMTLDETVSLWTAAVLFEPGNSQLWMPWTVAGLLFCIVSRHVQHGLVLPTCIVVATAGFYIALWITDTSIDEASTRGLLLGPFGDASFLAGLGTWIVTEARWGIVLSHLPSVVAVIGMTIIGSLLYASALELATGSTIEPDRELRGVGIANMLAALGGGLVGYHLLSQILFARSLGVTGRTAGFAVATVTAATLLFGASYLSVLPIGVFAALIAFIGFDLLVTWLWVERRRLPAHDFGIILLILAIAATVGFLEAIAAGLLATAIQFVVAYAATDVVRLRTTAATMRSRVERSEPDVRHLSRHGSQAAIYELTGYLFFGTANRLLDELVAMVAADRSGPKFVLIDFRRVQGIDASAAFALGKLSRACLENRVELILSGLSDRLQALLERSGVSSGDGAPRLVQQLDDALQLVEERLLADAGQSETAALGFLEELERLHPHTDVRSEFEQILARAGEQIIEQAAPTDSMMVLEAGSLRVEYLHPDGRSTSVARILPGALVGELGLYAGIPRTARVVAEEDCRLLKISTENLERLAQVSPKLAADIHRIAVSYLARRLVRTMALLHDADI